MKMIIYKLWITEGHIAVTHNSFYPVIEFYIPDLKMSVNEATVLKYDETRYQQIPKEDKMGDYPDPEMLGVREVPLSLIEPLVILKQSLYVDQEDVYDQLMCSFEKDLTYLSPKEKP